MPKDSIKRSQGAVRFRTDDFKSLRSKSKSNPRPIEFSQRDLKLAPQSSHINFNEHPRDILPPEWVDIYDKINEDFERLQEKSKKYSVKNLSEVQHEKQKKVFGEHSTRNKKIENLLEDLSKIIADIEGHIRNFTNNQGSEDDQKIRKNIQRKLAARLKEVTVKYRTAEHAYMGSFKVPDIKTDSSGLFEMEKQEEVKIEHVKNEEIQKLADNLAQVAEIFKELNLLVVDQGTILDRIDYCLVQSKENTQKANNELKKAAAHQSCTRATTCLLFLIVLIVLLLLTLIFKHT